MTTLVRRLTARVGQDQRLDLRLSDIPVGEVDVLIFKHEVTVPSRDALSLLPKHTLGKVNSALRREEIYEDGR